MSDIPIRVPPEGRVVARKKDQNEIWIVVQEGGTSTELYLHPYDTEKQAREGAEIMEASSYRVLLVQSILKDGPERVAYGLEAVCEELLAYLNAAPENLALPTVRNRFRRRIRTLLSKAQAHE